MLQANRQRPNSILLVEDHELTLTLLGELLARAFPITSVEVARTVAQAIECFRCTEPTVVVMDIGLPDGSGIDLTRQLLVLKPRATIVIHSTHDSDVFRQESLKAGAHAFVSKRNAAGLVAALTPFLLPT